MKVHYVLDCSWNAELHKFLRALLKQGIVLRIYVSPHIEANGTEHVHIVAVYSKRSDRRIEWIGIPVIFCDEFRDCSIQGYLSFSHGRKQPFFLQFHRLLPLLRS